MGFLNALLYPWGWILVIGAIIHFIRRRPDGYWLFVILFLGPVGALVYLLVEAVPDARLLGGSFKVFPRRKRIAELRQIVRDNPSAGNFEELGDLLMEDGRLAEARAALDRSIAVQAGDLDPHYRRGVCALLLGDAGAALPDLEYVVGREPRYDFDRAAGLLAEACAQTGETARAERLFREVTTLSTSSETYLNFAELLAREGKAAEARTWAQRVLDKRASLPGYQRRRERPQTRRARNFLRRVSA